MKSNHNLREILLACLPITILFLQNCNGCQDQLTPKEEESIKITSGESKTWSVTHRTCQSDISNLPVELWTQILLYLGTNGIWLARQVNTQFYGIISTHLNKNRWFINEEQDFRGAIFAHIGTPFSPLQLKLQSGTIPRFVFKRLTRSVRNLPQNLWVHLKDSNIGMINFSDNNMGNINAASFAEVLQNTAVHTLNLGNNRINNDWVTTFIQNLPSSSQLNTLILSNNSIGDGNIGPFITALQNTQIHTVDLWNNHLRNRGLSNISTALQATTNNKLHTICLGRNNIADRNSLIAFAQALQHMQVKKLT